MICVLGSETADVMGESDTARSQASSSLPPAARWRERHRLPRARLQHDKRGLPLPQHPRAEGESGLARRDSKEIGKGL